MPVFRAPLLQGARLVGAGCWGAMLKTPQAEFRCRSYHPHLELVLKLLCTLQVHLERKTREAEYLTARLVEESEKRQAEAERLRGELISARNAEKQAKEKLLNFLTRTSNGSLPPPSVTNVRIFFTSLSFKRPPGRSRRRWRDEPNSYFQKLSNLIGLEERKGGLCLQ